MGVRIFILLAAAFLIAMEPAKAAFSDDILPFEKTVPKYHLPGNRHPSLDQLIRGLEQGSLENRTDPEIWYQLGLSYGQANRYGDAVIALQRAVEFDPVHVRAWENLGFNLYHDGRPQEALSAFEKATRLGAAGPEVWNDYASLLIQQNRLADASVALDEGFKFSQTSRRLWNTLGVLKRTEKDYPASKLALNKALAIDPKYAVAWTNLGNTQVFMQDTDGAIQSLIKAVALDPQLGQAWLSLAGSYAIKKQWPEAMDAVKKAIALTPFQASPILLLGHAAIMTANWEVAVESFQKVLNDPPTRQILLGQGKSYVEILSEYGRAAVEINHLDDADKILAEGNSLDSNNSLILAAIGSLRIKQQRWPDALEAIQRSLAINPSVPRSWCDLGAIQMAMNQLDEARKSFEKAGSLQPDYAWAFLCAGQAAEKNNQTNEAIFNYRKALALQPNSIPTLCGLARLAADAGEADRLLAQAQTLDPKEALVPSTECFIRAKRQDWTGTETAAEAAVALHPENSTDWSLLALANSMQKKFADAVTDDEKAIQYGSTLPPKEQAHLWSELYKVHVNQVHEKGPSEWRAGLDAVRHATTLDPETSVYWAETALCLTALGLSSDAAEADAKWRQTGATPLQNSPSSTFGQPATPAPSNGIAVSAPAAAALTSAAVRPEVGMVAVCNEVKALIKNNQIAQAIDEAQHEVDACPNQSIPLYSLGEAYMAAKRTDDAIATLGRATILDQKMGPAWIDLSTCLADEGKYDDAINAAIKGVDLMPQVPMAWNQVVQPYSLKKDLAGAISKIGGLTQSHPDSSYGWFLLGELQGMKGDFALEQDSLQKAIDLKADYGDAWRAMAYNNLKLNQPEKALLCFEKVVQIQPNVPNVHNDLGYHYLLAGRTDEAIDMFKQELTLDPKNTRCCVNLVNAYAKKSEWNLAKTACDQLAQFDPSTAAQLNQQYPSLSSEQTEATFNGGLAPSSTGR